MEGKHLFVCTFAIYDGASTSVYMLPAISNTQFSLRIPLAESWSEHDHARYVVPDDTQKKSTLLIDDGMAKHGEEMPALRGRFRI